MIYFLSEVARKYEYIPKGNINMIERRKYLDALIRRQWYGEYDMLPFGSNSKRRTTSERKQKT